MLRMPRWITVAAGVWLAGAIALSATGRVAALPFPGPQMVLAGLTLLLVILGLSVPSFRAWLREVDPKVGIALHVTRFVGIAFLILYDRGELPYAFAVPYGIGDIAVAAVALVLVLAPRGPWWRPTAVGWNFLGLIDILLVVATAARLGMADQASLAPLLRLPLSLLPTFLVPIIIATHLWLFWRLRAPAPAPASVLDR